MWLVLDVTTRREPESRQMEGWKEGRGGQVANTEPEVKDRGRPRHMAHPAARNIRRRRSGSTPARDIGVYVCVAISLCVCGRWGGLHADDHRAAPLTVASPRPRGAKANHTARGAGAEDAGVNAVCTCSRLAGSRDGRWGWLGRSYRGRRSADCPLNGAGGCSSGVWEGFGSGRRGRTPPEVTYGARL